jgi:SAM-dependent methyltransferase
MPNDSENWFDSPLGQWIVREECLRCRRLIPAGYYPTSLQLGMPGRDYLGELDAVEVGTRFITMTTGDDRSGAGCGSQLPEEGDPPRRLVARPGALPFGEKTHSLIVMPHVLDFSDDPHRVLREVNQVLIPEGCVVITGFNHLSIWGLHGLLPGGLRRDKARAPWTGKHYRARRVQDWLSLLGIDVVGACMFAYQPPLQKDSWRAKLAFLDRMGDRWWPGLGAAYMIVGRKREFVSGTTGTRLAWRRFIPAIARPGVTASGVPATTGTGRARLRLVVKNTA